MAFPKLVLTEEQKQFLRENWDKTYDEIFALTGITKSYIHKYRKELNLPTKLGSAEEKKIRNKKFVSEWNTKEGRRKIRSAARAKGKSGIHYLNIKLTRLGLRKRSRSHWSKREIEILKKYWGESSSRNLMRRLKGRTWRAIRIYAITNLKLPASAPQGMICMSEACRITGFEHRQLLKIMQEQGVTTWANPFRKSLSTYRRGEITANGGTTRRYITRRFVEVDLIREAVEHHLRGEIMEIDKCWNKNSGKEFLSTVSGVGLGGVARDSGIEPEDGDEESDVDREEDKPAADKRRVNKKPRVVRQRVHSLPAVSQNVLSSSTEPLNALRSQR